jgi:hypothetical protein
MPKDMFDHLAKTVILPELSVSNRPDSVHPRLRTGASSRLTATLGAAALILNQTYSPQFILVQ